MKKLILFWILIFSLQIFAQDKAVALKFDEFDDAVEEYLFAEPISITQRIERFANQLKKTSNSKAYIIYYQSQISENSYAASNLAHSIKSILSYRKGIDSEKIVLIDGGIREKRTIEFWIAPKNAEPPKPSPQFDKSELILCPTMQVYGNGFSYNQNGSLDFTVFMSNVPENTTFEYEWKISAGRIVAGQGTKKITVDVDNVGSKNVTAFVKVKEIDYPCKNFAWSNLTVKENTAVLIDKFGRYNESEFKMRLDNLYTYLNNNPTTKGYIIIYASRTEGMREMERAIKSYKAGIAFRKFDASRVEIAKGGYRDENTIDMWILPQGTTPPKPTPTVDKKFVEVPVKKKTKNK